jgi:hypothetical protein
LNTVLAVAKAVHGPQPRFAGGSIDFLRAVMKGDIQPDPARMTAAMALAKFERPTLAASLTASGGQDIADQTRSPNLPVPRGGWLSRAELMD